MSTRGLRIGSVVVGRYRIDGELGAGAFGAVYRAHDLQRNRPVALKVLHAHRALKDRDIARFEREAALLQRLRHPNVVEILAFGSTKDGIPYIAFELVEGRPLNEVLKERGALPQEIVRRIAGQVLSALAAAHEIGIVHRDIKPGNVLVDATFEVKVLDFGIAKALGEEGEDLMTKLTATGAILGTPAYMAPEQVRGQTIRPSTDVYSLGVLMAELLSGERLIQAKTPIDALTEHISDTDHQLHAAVRSSVLTSVVSRAVAKRPEQRYASAREMLAALTATAVPSAKAPITGSTGARVAPTQPERPPTPPVVAAAPVLTATMDEPPLRASRGRLFAGVFATLIALAAFAGAGWWLFLQPPPDDDDVAVIDVDDDGRERDDDDDDDGKRPETVKPEPAPVATPIVPPETVPFDDPMVAKMTTFHIKRRLERHGYRIDKTTGGDTSMLIIGFTKSQGKGGGICMLLSYASEARRRADQQANSSIGHSRGGGRKLLTVTPSNDTGRQVLALLTRPPLETRALQGKKKKKKKVAPPTCDPKDPLCKKGRRIVKPPQAD